MVKLFTHIDLDGVGCAVLARLAFGNAVEIEYCNYNDVNERVETFLMNGAEQPCHITDISITADLAKKFTSSTFEHVLLDHHATALYLNEFNWCTVNTIDDVTGITTSGTELYYKWLVANGYLDRDEMLDTFVELVRDYDTWRWASLGETGKICKQVNDLLYIYGRDKFITWCVTEIYDCVFPRLYAVDELVLKIKQEEIDSYIATKDKQLIPHTLCNRPCGVVFAEQHTSELGNTLCKLHPEFDFIVIININGTVSYRSAKDDIDLGNDIAKVFNGGGHKKAAGSKIPSDFKLFIINELFK